MKPQPACAFLLFSFLSVAKNITFIYTLMCAFVRSEQAPAGNWF
ncbi:hypothetical protein CLOM621_05831 [Clostridium sp. M62/1]|nr:hypothetical protein CLOM621_05831 [Clostridium sp. M62/1]